MGGALLGIAKWVGGAAVLGAAGWWLLLGRNTALQYLASGLAYSKKVQRWICDRKSIAQVEPLPPPPPAPRLPIFLMGPKRALDRCGRTAARFGSPLDRASRTHAAWKADAQEDLVAFKSAARLSRWCFWLSWDDIENESKR
jgi:hypothetical protein